jgi:hypothetical protein
MNQKTGTSSLTLTSGSKQLNTLITLVTFGWAAKSFFLAAGLKKTKKRAKSLFLEMLALK